MAQAKRPCVVLMMLFTKLVKIAWLESDMIKSVSLRSDYVLVQVQDQQDTPSYNGYVIKYPTHLTLDN